MGWETSLVDQIQRTLVSAEIVSRFRVEVCDFTRVRQLGFALVVLLILRGHRHALQTTLNRLFSALGWAQKVPTASAVCHARQKIKPELFLHLNSQVIQALYALPWVEWTDVEWTDKTATKTPLLPLSEEEVPPLLRWHGHRLLGVDGTRWNLPDTPGNQEHYGTATNQHPHFACAQASGSILYDVLNDVGLHAALAPTQSEKAVLFSYYAEHTEAGDVLVMDRLYGDYSVLAELMGHGRHVVVRLSRTTFGQAVAFGKSSEVDKVVTLQVTASQKKWAREHNLPLRLRVRLVKITLSTGEIEVLLTSLLDATTYSLEELGQVYGWRWRVESYIDRLKNGWEIERSGSRKREHLEQDFYGVLFLSTLESALTRRAQHELEQQSQRRRCRYGKQVNRAVSRTALLDHALVLLTDQGKTAQEVLHDLHALFQTNPVLQRPGRHLPREKVSASRKLRHHRYTKRA